MINSLLTVSAGYSFKTRLLLIANFSDVWGVTACRYKTDFRELKNLSCEEVTTIRALRSQVDLIDRHNILVKTSIIYLQNLFEKGGKYYSFNIIIYAQLPIKYTVWHRDLVRVCSYFVLQINTLSIIVVFFVIKMSNWHFYINNTVSKLFI